MRSKILENQVRSGQLSSGHVFGGRATSRPLVWKGRGTQRHSRMCPPLKRSFVTFDRGGQTGPPRSNDFFSAPLTTRVPPGRPAERPRPNARPDARCRHRDGRRRRPSDIDDTDAPGQLFSRTIFREYPLEQGF